MSAYVAVEFTVKDPDDYVSNTPPKEGQTAKEHGGEILAAGNWEFLPGDGVRGSRAVSRPGDRFQLVQLA